MGQPSRIRRDWSLEIDSTNNFELTEGNLLNSAIDYFESMMYAELLFRRLNLLIHTRRVILVFVEHSSRQFETNRTSGEVTSCALFTAGSRCEMAMWMTLFR